MHTTLNIMKVRNLYILLLALFLFSSQSSYSQIGDVDGKPTTRVLLIGDSWANFMWTYESMGEALRQNGFADIKENGNLMAIVGMQAEVWASEGFIDVLKAKVKQHNKADVYVIFIGGNDVVWKWRRDKPADILLPYADEMFKYTDEIINEILKINPEGQIVIGSYDYTNFAESMEVEWNPYRDQWEKFGLAPPEMLNDALIFFEEYRMAYYKAKNHPNIHFINNLGVVQYYGGYPTPSIYEPYGTLEPRTVPLPYGDKRYPNHLNFMGNYVDLVPDAFHLNGLGYQYIAHNMIQNFIGDYLKKDFNHSIKSVGKKDGWTSSTGQAKQGDLVRVGKVNDQHHAGIFTFNTSDFPEGVTIDKGSLYLGRSYGVGRLRVGSGRTDHIEVEMKVGHFGENDQIESDDYDAPADFKTVGRVVGNPLKDEYKFRVDLSQEVLDAIANSEQVQFRVTVNFDEKASNLMFYDFFGGDAEDRDLAPTLDLSMSEVPVVSHVSQKKIKPLSVYPNPSSDYIHVDIPEEMRSGNTSLSLINTLGSVVKSYKLSNNHSRETIHLNSIPAGVYNLTITDGVSIRGSNIIVQ